MCESSLCRRLRALAVAAAVLGLFGCAEEPSLSTQPAPEDPGSAASKGRGMTGDQPPRGLVTVSFAGSNLRVWPYAGKDFSGDGTHLANVFFVGEADLLQIRAALESLDGDRTAYGFPSELPYNDRWHDTPSDARTGYAERAGWVGDVVQLELGDDSVAHFSLLLFQTRQPFGGDGVWTFGAAFLEYLPSNGVEPRVIDWETAEEIVKADFLRSGLLDETTPFVPTGTIHSSPAFRQIPRAFYNQLPQDAIDAIDGPPKPVSGPVPIPSDGRGIVLNLARSVPIQPGLATYAGIMPVDQIMRQPICASGGHSFVRIVGPFNVTMLMEVTAAGGYRFNAEMRGVLTMTPVDISTEPPTPIGPPVPVAVTESQQASADERGSLLIATMVHFLNEAGAPLMEVSHLTVGSPGAKFFTSYRECP